MIEATWTNARKFRAVFSYRVATRLLLLRPGPEPLRLRPLRLDHLDDGPTVVSFVGDDQITSIGNLWINAFARVMSATLARLPGEQILDPRPVVVRDGVAGRMAGAPWCRS